MNKNVIFMIVSFHCLFMVVILLFFVDYYEDLFVKNIVIYLLSICDGLRPVSI